MTLDTIDWLKIRNIPALKRAILRSRWFTPYGWLGDGCDDIQADASIAYIAAENRNSEQGRLTTQAQSTRLRTWSLSYLLDACIRRRLLTTFWLRRPATLLWATVLRQSYTLCVLSSMTARTRVSVACSLCIPYAVILQGMPKATVRQCYAWTVFEWAWQYFSASIMLRV